MDKTIKILVFHECCGEHTHRYPQILVPLENTMKIVIEGASYKVTPQELCLVPEGMHHECNYFGKMLAMNFEETPDNKVMIARPIIVSMHGQIMQLVSLIQAELKSEPDSKAVGFLYNYLYSKLLENQEPPSIRYIYDHYDLPITVDTLARIEAYNVSYYNDWFKQQTGVTPGIYLRRTRVEKAKELLKDTDFTVTDISGMVGYSSNSTFTRAFRSITGMAPNTYRSASISHEKDVI